MQHFRTTIYGTVLALLLCVFFVSQAHAQVANSGTNEAIDITNFTTWDTSARQPLVLTQNSVETSPQFVTKSSFESVTVIWQGIALDDNIAFEFRTRQSGSWGPWQTIEKEEDSEAVAVKNPEPNVIQRSSIIYMVPKSDAVAVRISGVQSTGAALTKLRIFVTNIEQTPTLREAQNAAASARGNISASSFTNAVPPIIPRTAWGVPEDAVAWDPEYRPVQKIIIHHTVTSSGIGTDPVKVVQSVYNSHTYGNGWGDIGYNFVVDGYGNIYEGRAGGMRVVGGHTTGHNYGSAAIAVLGNYQTSSPSAASLASVAQMAGWLAARNGLNPWGSSFFVDRVNNNIGGHRDWDTTSCPGNNLYVKLYDIKASATNWFVTYRTNRLAGSDRYATATAISQDWYGSHDRAGYVVLVNGQDFTQSLPAAPLAGALQAPILLTNSDTLNATTAAEIDRLLPLPYTVVLVGDETQISAGIADDLTARGYTVARKSGADMYETAVAVASDPVLSSATSAIVVASENFPDALSATGAAAKYKIPLLLTQQNTLPTATRDFLTTNPNINTVFVIGGTAAVSDDVYNELAALSGVTTYRFGGDTRYDTAAIIAREFFGDATMALLVNGENFPDSLSVGPYAGWLNTPILLTSTDNFSTPTNDYIRWKIPTLVSGRVIGGTVVVSDTIAQQFDGSFQP